MHNNWSTVIGVTHRAPAKINIGLRLTGRRPDGYHELASLFWPVSICDDLRFEPDTADRVDVHWDTATTHKPAIPSNDNIVARTLGRLRQIAEIPYFRVTILKRIPVGGGLGGGSSNAATTLRVLSAGLGVDHATINDIAAGLGADVPFFLEPAPTWVTGVGEIRQLLSFESALAESLGLLVLLPAFSSRTADVFSEFRESDGELSLPVTPLNRKLSLSSLKEYTLTAQNDLLPIVAARHPQILALTQALSRSGAFFSSMSGSGSSLFGLYETSQMAVASAQVLLPICREYDCRLLTAQTYRV
ncbi:MAG: hypothetical protein HYR96_13610 [Deltaproteobacteria bacterium]|nr:hypothetical protein [Deltaproteobacteria bacterium]MBI3293814.1 hypothetical protein [Deltaproteobacteria bacterium]